MTFKTLESLVKTHTQDAQSKLPSTFPQWKIVIDEGIKKIDLEVDQEVMTDDILDSEDGNIPLVEDIAMALVYHLSQLFTNDVNLKQKYIMDYEDTKGVFIWNKFKESELSK